MTDFTFLVLKNMVNIGELLMTKSLLHVKLMETKNLHSSSLLMVKLLLKALDTVQHQSWVHNIESQILANKLSHVKLMEQIAKTQERFKISLCCWVKIAYFGTDYRQAYEKSIFENKNSHSTIGFWLSLSERSSFIWYSWQCKSWCFPCR